jgi:hypothetical protein
MPIPLRQNLVVFLEIVSRFAESEHNLYQFLAAISKAARLCYFRQRFKHCCEAGAKNRVAEIKFPPGVGAGAKFTNCGPGSGSLLFITNLKKFVKKEIFHGIL